MGCNNICERLTVKKPISTSRYLAGQKYCTVCQVWMQLDDIRCPCCHMRVRSVPRKFNLLKKFRANVAERLSFDHDSWISKVTYMPSTKRMVIKCKDNKNSYELENVPLEKYREFESAPSKGAYYNQNFRNNSEYAHRWFK